jgi:hypothetical protein
MSDKVNIFEVAKCGKKIAGGGWLDQTGLIIIATGCLTFRGKLVLFGGRIFSG